MALPQTVRVKISSEAAGAITITPVVAQDLPVRELIEYALGVAGKDEGRLCEILRRGSLVAGASRFRWTGWEASLEEVRDALTGFPDPDPSIPFDPARCFRAALRDGRRILEIPKEATERAGMFRRASFWDELMAIAVACGAAYAGYSYRDRADRYVASLAADHVERLRAAGSRLRYATLREQVGAVAFSEAELWTTRPLR